MLVRMFGIFGVILGAAYFNEGVRAIGILQFAASEKLRGMFLTWLSFMAWDFLFGGSLIIAAIGVLLFKEFGRMMWLRLMPALVLVHLGIIVYTELLGGGVSAAYLIWTEMIIITAATLWYHLTGAKSRARFSRPNENSGPSFGFSY
jgi:hypothetical protein